MGKSESALAKRAAEMGRASADIVDCDASIEEATLRKDGDGKFPKSWKILKRVKLKVRCTANLNVGTGVEEVGGTRLAGQLRSPVLEGPGYGDWLTEVARLLQHNCNF